MILEENMKFNKTGIEPEKAQALEVQKWTVDDCSRIFQIPPHKLGSMEYSKYNNVEQLQIDFVTSTMMYWLKTWEQECNYKLFMAGEREKVFCEFLIEGLLRGNMQAQSQFFRTGRQWGYLSANDIRAWLNMNPIGPKGDIYLEPLNMKPAGTETPNEPEPPKEPVDDDVRQALRDMIVSQFMRVVTKRSRDGFKPEHLNWACKILEDPVRAYAGMMPKVKIGPDIALLKAVGEYVNPGRTLSESHAEQFAERVTHLLGGNNHANS
jgi:hypothetical protein